MKKKHFSYKHKNSVNQRVGRQFLYIPVKEQWVQADVFGRGCWHSSFAFAVFFWQLAGAKTKPISLEEEIKIISVFSVWQG